MPKLLRLTAWTLALVGLTAAPVVAQDTSVRIRVPLDITIEIDDVMDDVLDSLDVVVRQLDVDLHEMLRAAGRGLQHLDALDALGHLDRLGDLRHVSGIGSLRWSQDRDFRASRTDEQTHRLNLGATGSLELRNVAGDVTVAVGSGATTTVEVIRVARGRTDEDAQNGLERVRVDVNEGPGRASFVARHPNNERRFSVTVEYRVTTPAGTRLTVDTVAGDVTVRGVQGDISLKVISGDVEIERARRLSRVETISGRVTLTDIDNESALDVTNVAGAVLLQRVRADRISVKAVSGRIGASEVTTNDATLSTMTGRIEFTGPFNPNGRYEFQTHNGGIELTVAGGGGFDFRASTFSGGIDVGAGIDASGLSTSRRAVRGRVGDGGAVVIATTFSGGVTIRRR